MFQDLMNRSDQISDQIIYRFSHTKFILIKSVKKYSNNFSVLILMYSETIELSSLTEPNRIILSSRDPNFFNISMFFELV